jgi:hypothetical protein
MGVFDLFNIMKTKVKKILHFSRPSNATRTQFCWMDHATDSIIRVIDYVSSAQLQSHCFH